MPQVGFLPRQQSFISGVVAPGSVLRFFQTGTSTPQNAYTDAALSSAVTSLTADSAGLFAKWYLNPSAAADYRYTLESSAGAVYYTEDNIPRRELSQSDIVSLLYPQTAAELAAGITPTNYLYPTLDVRRYGSFTGDDSADDLTAWNSVVAVAKQLGGATVTNGPGVLSFISDTVVLDSGDVSGTTRGVIIDLNGGRLRTSANASIVRLGATSSSTDAYRKNGVVNGILRGAGSGNSSNHGIELRNHSFAVIRNLRIENCGAKAITMIANTRGVQYNDVSDVEITENFDGVLTLDTGAAAGGYVNDNTFFNVRGHENPNTGGGAVVHVHLGGARELTSNRFIAFSAESQEAAHTLLKIDTGDDNLFDGVRLDGTVGTTAVNIASGCDANVFIDPSIDGTIIDASNTTISILNDGSNNEPKLRLGSLAGAANSWDVGLFTPGSTRELHIKYNDAADGIVRFPVNTEVFFGNRSNGDNGPIEIVGEDKVVRLRTLSDTAIGSGPALVFDGEFSSSGNEGSCTVRQDANGVNFNFSTAGDSIHSTQTISLADGITAPAAVSGRAKFYVDTADGDLKVIFGDGTVKTIVTDT